MDTNLGMTKDFHYTALIRRPLRFFMVPDRGDFVAVSHVARRESITKSVANHSEQRWPAHSWRSPNTVTVIRSAICSTVSGDSPGNSRHDKSATSAFTVSYSPYTRDARQTSRAYALSPFA